MSQRNTTMSIREFNIPKDEKLEKQILSEMLMCPECINNCRKRLKEEYFTDPKRAEVYRAFCDMDEKHETIDLITLGQKVGQEYVIRELVSGEYSGTGIGLEMHCLILAENYLRRQAYLMAVKMLQKSSTPGSNVDNIIGEIDQFREAVIDTTKTDATVTIGQALSSLADSLMSADKHVTTGFRSLDDLTYGGFEAGQLNIIAARPSVGKTAVALFMAHQAARAKKKVHIYSLEMTKEELAKRFMFAMESISPYDVSKRAIDWTEFEKVVAYYEGLGIFINDQINSIDEIVAEITAQVRMNNLDAVYIDYLGLIREVAMETEAGRKANTIAMVTKRLKDLSKQLHVPVILLCQLNRNSVLNGNNRPPVLADLRDSGAIEQDADCVVMLEPKVEMTTIFGSDQQAQEVNKDILNLWLRKNRNGRRDVAIKVGMNTTHTNYKEEGIITE